MIRIGSCLILASVMFVGGAGCGKSGEGKSGEVKSGGGSTPEAAFNNLAEAAKKEDMRGFMTNLTKDSQKMMVGGLVVAASMMKQFAAFTKSDTKELESVMTKHGINEEAVMTKMKSMGPGADPFAGASELASVVKDGPGFVTEMNGVMKKMGKGKENSPADDFKDTKLSDVKITGDTATGKLEKTGKTQEIHFAKEDGVWKIDILPMIRAEMKKKERTE